METVKRPGGTGLGTPIGDDDSIYPSATQPKNNRHGIYDVVL